MPKCNLTALLKSNNKNTCGTFVPAGTGDRIYVFDLDDDVIGQIKDVAPADTGFYNEETFKNVLNGRLYPIDIKTDTGQVTSEKAEDAEGRTLTGTAVIDHSIDRFLAIDAAMAFMNLGVLIPMDDQKCYVIMSPYKRVKYSSNYDSGTTYDSDHGFTITFTVSPVLYGCPMVLLSGSDLRNLMNTTDLYSQYQGTTASNKFRIDKLAVTGGKLSVMIDNTEVNANNEYDANKLVVITATPTSSSGNSAKITVNGIVVDQGAANEAVTWKTPLSSNMIVGATFTK